MPEWSAPSRRPLPLILIRGFGGLGIEDEKRIAYQGFNDGTVYPNKRGDNYIYEGMILKFMKSSWQYQDATNVVGYFPTPVVDARRPTDLSDLPDDFFFQPADSEEASRALYKVVIDPAMARNLRDRTQTRDPNRTLWVFRYYDLNDRSFRLYGDALMRLIDFIRELAASGTGDARMAPKVNIIAHSMGGLIVREAIQGSYPAAKRRADDHINKVVTLGTPHQGISFQVLSSWIGIDAREELDHFSPDFQADRSNENPLSFRHLHEHFDLQRFLTVVGTNYRTYGVKTSSWANRLFSLAGEYGPNYNRSDGLVKQRSAQIPGAPRTFVHKCHGGVDSLVTSREAFEIASRFFFGDRRVRIRMIFFGVSIKPRRVDFDLFHQSVEAENCYGPFSATDENGDVNFSEMPDKLAFGWADDRRLIWEGYLDVRKILEQETGDNRKEIRGKGKKPRNKDMVFRLDFYVGERDLFGIGFSDNVVFRQQYYILTTLPEKGIPQVYCYPDERFAAKDFVLSDSDKLVPDRYGWSFNVENAGFWAQCRIELAQVPENGYPARLESVSVLQSADSPNPEPEQPAAGASDQAPPRKEGVEKGVQLRRTGTVKIPETK